MTTRLIAAPAALPVSIEDAREALRLEGDTSLDSSITRWVKGIAMIAESLLERAFITQTWRVTLDAFPVAEDGGPGAIRLDHAPIQAVIALHFVDVDGASQVLDPADYLVDVISEPGCIVVAPGKGWPVTADRINAVHADYTCGFGDDDTSIPENIKLYILTRLVEQFDPATRTERATVQSEFLDRMLDACKVY